MQKPMSLDPDLDKYDMKIKKNPTNPNQKQTPQFIFHFLK